MALPPIQVQLSPFEQLEILRQEVELRGEELKETEKYIRQLQFEVERQNYLKSIHPLFQQLQAPAEAANMPQLLANREALAGAIDTMKAALASLELAAKGRAVSPGVRPTMPTRPGVPPLPSAPGLAGVPKRAKFDSFDDFRMQKPPGPPRT